LRTILQKAIKDHRGILCDPAFLNSVPHYWDANFFGLEKVGAFRALKPEDQLRVLSILEQSLLDESYYIERLGGAYISRMIPMAQTLEEKSLYGMIGAEEAAHLHSIESFQRRPAQPHQDQPFICLLKELIESGDRIVMIFVVQVVLEGWGLTHYRLLMEGTPFAPLKTALQKILSDEVRHHGSGIILFRESPLSLRQVEMIVAVLEKFFAMVKAGSVALLAALEGVSGGFTENQRIRTLQELRSDEKAREKLELLKRIIFNHCQSENQKRIFSRISAQF